MSHDIGDDEITVLNDSAFFNQSGEDFALQVWLTYTLSSVAHQVICTFTQFPLRSESSECPPVNQSQWTRLGSCTRSVPGGAEPTQTTIYVVPPGTPVGNNPPSNYNAVIDWGPDQNLPSTPAASGALLLMIGFNNGELYSFCTREDLPSAPGLLCTVDLGFNVPLNLQQPS